MIVISTVRMISHSTGYGQLLFLLLYYYVRLLTLFIRMLNIINVSLVYMYKH